MGAGQSSRTDQSFQPGQSSQYSQSTQPGQSSQYSQSTQPGQSGQFSQSTQSGQSSQYSQSTQSGQAGQYNQSTQTGQSGQYSAGRRPDQQADYYRQSQQNPNGYYQNPYASGPVYSQVPPQPKKTKKKHSMAGRIAGITAAALLFGTVSGAAMVGINVVSDRFFQESVPAETEPVTIGRAETEAEEPKKETIAQASQAIVTDVSAIVERAMPSVVAINNTMLYQANTWFGPTQTYEVPSSGSGIIVGQNDEELLIVTNNHVVADSNNLSVVLIDDQSVEATIKGTDADSDLAVVAVPLSSISAETLSQISVAKIGDSDSLKVGQGVIAIGNALGYGQSVTVGYVSALNREVKTEESSTRTLLQTDAAINPGNSGGALLNMQGELIGINAAKYSSTEVEGMGYAIPISQATDIINELMNRKTRNAVEESKQGYLGIQGKNIDETAAREFGMPRGVYVYKILDDGAAAQSTLREKDIITKFDGQSIRSMTDLQDLLTYYEGGETVTLTVQSLADGQYAERSVDVTLGFRPQVGTSK
ncbi:trypsin-like serine protease [Clostridium sp. MCC353]|nr:trypsin-like serine protease [Clostridium sp. MCC353]